MKILFVLPAVFLFSIHLSLAADVYKVPTFSESESREKVLTKKNLSADTLVQHYYFSVSVPKGWSINPVGPSERMRASLTATPTADIENGRTYFGIHSLKASPQLDVDARYEKFKKEKPSWKLSFSNWNGAKWLVCEYINSSNGSDVKTWAAFTVVGGQEYVMTVATPISESTKYEPVLKKLMESVIISR